MQKRKSNFERLWPSGVSDTSAFELRSLDDREFMQLRRAVVKRSRKRAANPKANDRALVKKRRVEPRMRYTKAVMLAKPRKNEILDALVVDRASKWRRYNRRKPGARISCKDFSLIDNPLRTLDTLARIAEADCDSIYYEIDFEDAHVLDIAPFLVFGVMREGMAPMCRGGTVKAGTRKVLEAVGLREFLRMKPFGRMRMDDVWPMPLMQRRRAGTSRSRKIAVEPTTAEIRADQIVNRVDEWLRELTSPLQLTDHGRGRITGIVTETLNNAERHGRLDGDGEWIVAGFMARRQHVGGHEGFIHVCHLCFMNLGRPISETIMKAPADTTVQIDRYCDRHAGAGIGSPTLATVFALQDGISRFDQSAGNVSGGTGLMDMVEFANEVGRCQISGLGPKVAIVSGRSYVRFEAPYNEGFGTAHDERRLQWFNSVNSISDPPDGSHVMDLPSYFPGTVITMRFVLDGSVQEAS